jgi:hypothetical protein
VLAKAGTGDYDGSKIRGDLIRRTAALGPIVDQAADGRQSLYGFGDCDRRGHWALYNQLAKRDSHDWDVDSPPTSATMRSGKRIVVTQAKLGSGRARGHHGFMLPRKHDVAARG